MIIVLLLCLLWSVMIFLWTEDCSDIDWIVKKSAQLHDLSNIYIYHKCSVATRTDSTEFNAFSKAILIILFFTHLIQFSCFLFQCYQLSSPCYTLAPQSLFIL